MSKFLISGATGFIGSRLIKKLLDENHDISIITRKSSNYENIKNIKSQLNIFEYDGEIQNLIDIFNKIKPDITIHLASVFIAENKPEDVENLIDSNIKFATQILEAMKYSNSKYFINTSSYAQHYNEAKYNPMNLYAATKQAFEDIIKYYCDACHIQSITLELFDTYGPNDPRPKVLNLLDKFSKENTCLNMSEGNQILDINHIDDVVQAYIIAIDLVMKKNDNIPDKFSLISNNRIKLKELICLYEKVTNKKVLVNWGAKPYRDREVLIPWSNGIKLPGWSPKFSIEDGLRDSFCKGD